MKNAFYLAAPLLAVAFLSSPAWADDAAEIAALKEQIQQLSQQVSKLQSQSDGVQPTATARKSAHKKSAKAAATAQQQPSPAEASSAETTTAPVAAAQPVASSDVVTKGSFPGSFKIPGTDTSVKIGGYVKLDAIGDIGEGYGAPYAKFYAIPLKTDVKTQQGGQSTFGAQQSRLNLETHTNTAWGDLKTFIEGDFYGATAANGNINGYGLQLRHAYGSLGPILAGQTWSNFMDTNAAPESLDYVGPAGRVFVRQAQIRYTRDIGPVTASASVESALGNNSAWAAPVGVTSTAGGTITPRATYPDVTLRGDYHYAKDGYVSLHGVGGVINVDRTVGTTDDTATRAGYAIGLSGRQTTVDKDSVTYDGNYGRGLGRYVYDVGATSNYYNPMTGSLDEQQFFAATAGYQHYWSDQFRSNLFGGFVRNVNNDNAIGALVANTTTAEAVNKYVVSGHANLIWQPAKSYSVGIEYMRGYRKTESGIEGTLNRVESSFMYNF